MVHLDLQFWIPIWVSEIPIAIRIAEILLDRINKNKR